MIRKDFDEQLDRRRRLIGSPSRSYNGLGETSRVPQGGQILPPAPTPPLNYSNNQSRFLAAEDQVAKNRVGSYADVGPVARPQTNDNPIASPNAQSVTPPSPGAGGPNQTSKWNSGRQESNQQGAKSYLSVGAWNAGRKQFDEKGNPITPPFVQVAPRAPAKLDPNFIPAKPVIAPYQGNTYRLEPNTVPDTRPTSSEDSGFGTTARGISVGEAAGAAGGFLVGGPIGAAAGYGVAKKTEDDAEAEDSRQAEANKQNPRVYIDGSPVDASLEEAAEETGHPVELLKWYTDQGYGLKINSDGKLEVTNPGGLDDKYVGGLDPNSAEYKAIIRQLEVQGILKKSEPAPDPKADRERQLRENEEKLLSTIDAEGEKRLAQTRAEHAQQRARAIRGAAELAAYSGTGADYSAGVLGEINQQGAIAQSRDIVNQQLETQKQRLSAQLMYYQNQLAQANAEQNFDLSSKLQTQAAATQAALVRLQDELSRRITASDVIGGAFGLGSNIGGLLLGHYLTGGAR